MQVELSLPVNDRLLRSLINFFGGLEMNITQQAKWI